LKHHIVIQALVELLGDDAPAPKSPERGVEEPAGHEADADDEADTCV
jgi:hypothetical protein